MIKNLTILTFLFVVGLGFAQENKKSSIEYIREGIDYHDNEQYEKAIKCYEKVGLNDTNYALSQFEIGLSYIGLEKYKKAQEILKDLLQYRIKFSFKPDVYQQLGNAYDMDKNPQMALKYYNEGIEKFPYNNHLIFNRGVCYEQQKEYEKALEDYQKAISINVYHANAHLRLGLLCANQKYNSQALLSLSTFAWIVPEDSRTPSVVSIMSQIANGSYEPEEDEKTEWRMYEDDPFQDVNTLFDNYTALQKNYKVKLTIKAEFAKQLHMILSNQKYDKDNKDFWNRTYLPFYQSILEAKKFDDLILLFFYNFKNSDIQKKIKPKTAKIKDFYEWSSTLYKNVLTERIAPYEGKDQFMYIEQNRKHITAIGKVNQNKDKAVGNWYYFHPTGNLQMKSETDEKGDPIGTWDIFNQFTDKVEKRIEFLDNNKRNITTFYETGEVFCKYVELNDLYQDTVTYFYRDGSIKSIVNYVEGEQDGLYTSYHPNGKVAEKINFKKGKANGLYQTYYGNGQLSIEMNIVDDKVQGVRKEYFEDGKLSSEKTFLDNELDGNTTEYFPNGTLSSKGTYKKGKSIGKVENYYSNGTVSSIVMFDESGKENGMNTWYDLDGKKYHEFDVKNNEITEIRFFDKSGTMKKVAERKMKKLDYQSFYANGNLSSKGLIDGLKKDGKWEYFDEYGNLRKIEFFDDGVVVDSIVYYFINGKVRESYQVKNGEIDGDYFEYDIFGNKIVKGEYVEGELMGEYINYFKNGAIEKERYFVNGSQHGFQKTFRITGQLSYFSEYDKGEMITDIKLDTLENTVSETTNYNGKIENKSLNNQFVSFVGNYKNNNAEGDFTWYGPNNTISTKGQYSNDEKIGLWTYYYMNGKVFSTINYLNDERHGKELDYYINGNKKTEYNYVRGEGQGEFFHYYNNGKVNITGKLIDNERHGKVTTYSPDGEVMYIRNYERGILVSYTYLGKDGKEVTPIPITSKEAKMICYYKNGTKSLECNRINGEIVGKFYLYYSSGKLMEEAEYYYGEASGNTVEYYENGQKSLESTSKNDEYEGDYILYYPNGKMEYKASFIEGVKHGEEIFFSNDGKVLKTITYYDGEPIQIK